MKVLFISSGNLDNGISPIIYNQGESLQSEEYSIEYYTIKGRGILGYFRNIFLLKKYLRKNNYQIVHAHYSLSAYVASLAGAKPLIVSLMGSDVREHGFNRIVIKIFNYLFFWKAIIVKSEGMYSNLKIKKAIIIPNGVNLKIFEPRNREECCKILGWSTTKINILFAADPSRIVKNYTLARDAIKILSNDNIFLYSLGNISNKELPTWYNAADVVILSSFWEGSPNVIKESMSCNRPIVSTSIGDVEWLFGEEQGHFIAGFDPRDFAEKIQQAINFSIKFKHTEGRARISFLELDTLQVAIKIKSIYKEIYNSNDSNR